MIGILSRAGLATLTDYARRGALLGFDFDGTLAPIVTDPAAAVMRPQTHALFAQVAARFPCVVISGRSRKDALTRLADVPLREVFGNHGMEPWPHNYVARAQIEAQVQRWEAQLRAALGPIAGIEVEQKKLSLSVHYRRCRDKEGAMAAIDHALAALPGLRRVAGKQVVNVLPVCYLDKGAALLRAMAELGAARSVFIGDDITDEDVFALAPPDRILSVRVGHARWSRATHFLRNQTQIDALLEALLAA